MYAIPVQPPPGRWSYALSLVRLAGRLVLRPSTPVPSARVNIPVPGRTRGARVDALRDIADRLGVTEEAAGDVLTAERRVGCLLLEAHVPADDLTLRFPVVPGMPDFDDLVGAGRRWAAGDIPVSAA